MNVSQLLGQIGGRLGIGPQAPNMGNQTLPTFRPPAPVDGGGAMTGQQTAVPNAMLAPPPVEALHNPLGGQPQLVAVQGKKDSGLRSFLGNLGDALLIGSGAAPMYAPSVKRRELGEQLSAYLSPIDAGLANLARSDPETGMRLFQAFREDTRFDRTMDQEDDQFKSRTTQEGKQFERNAGQRDLQIELGYREQDERERSNMVGEVLTARGQNISQRGQDVGSKTQLRLAQLRGLEAAADRAHQAAMKAGDYAHAENMLARQQQFTRDRIKLEVEMKGSGIDDGGTVTVTTEEPEHEVIVDDGYVWDTTKKVPGKKTVTTRKLPPQSDIEYTAKKHGISVEEVKRRLGAP